MAAPEADADLMGLGEHCSVASCGQVDFLPFTCDCCQRVYCLDHRQYASHSCPQAGERLTEVIVCPLCAKGVKMGGRDPNVVFDEHQRNGCDPANYNKVHKKPRCPVQGCKEKLSTINTYHCKTCSSRVCLKHRDADDHNCAQAKALLASLRASTAASSMMDRIKQSVMPSTTTGSSSTTSRPTPAATAPRPTSAQQVRAKALQQYADPANSVQGTAARRRQEDALAASNMVSNPMHSTSSNANPYVPPHLPEVCPQCNARFASVDRLVTHVEEYHQHPTQQATLPAPSPLTQASNAVASAFNSGAQALASAAATASSHLQGTGGAGGAAGAGRAGGGGGEAYRCPHCFREFSDAVVLVGHVEGCAALSGRGRVVAAGGSSGAGSKGDCCVQ